MRQLIISLIISLLTVTFYHLYLVRTGRLSPCLKGIYTVNLTESIDTLRKIALRRTVEGEKQPEKLLMKLQIALDRLAERLPEGYLILPESCVLAGKRKKIDLLTGKIRETEEAEKIVR